MKKGLLNVIVISMVLAFAASVMAMGSSQPSTYTKTKYPIMMVPGVLGFDKMLGVMDYWYKMPDTLKKDGATVRCAELSPFNDNTIRGEQLLAQVKQYIADTGASKVNIISHSHGTTTSRYVVHMRPDLVASLTTIAGPHGGTPVADFGAELPGFLQDALFAAIDLVGGITNFLSGMDYANDTEALMEFFSHASIVQFNIDYPSAGVPTTTCGNGAASEIINGNKIYYYSWTGSKPLTNVFDPLDALFTALGAINTFYGNEAASDGFIPKCSAHFGTVLRDDYPWNHGDEINHTLGVLGLMAPDPVEVVRQHANRLKNAGI
ncbi:MAG: triacylglycerol lipase [Desulfobacterales bacterium]|nr:triacylglycerol lipase [Desulfobacterales bacterium]